MRAEIKEKAVPQTVVAKAVRFFVCYLKGSAFAYLRHVAEELIDRVFQQE